LGQVPNWPEASNEACKAGYVFYVARDDFVSAPRCAHYDSPINNIGETSAAQQFADLARERGRERLHEYKRQELADPGVLRTPPDLSQDRCRYHQPTRPPLGEAQIRTHQVVAPLDCYQCTGV